MGFLSNFIEDLGESFSKPAKKLGAGISALAEDTGTHFENYWPAYAAAGTAIAAPYLAGGMAPFAVAPGAGAMSMAGSQWMAGAQTLGNFGNMASMAQMATSPFTPQQPRFNQSFQMPSQNQMGFAGSGFSSGSPYPGLSGPQQGPGQSSIVAGRGGVPQRSYGTIDFSAGTMTQSPYRSLYS